MSPEFDRLFHAHAAASFEKQLRLNELVGEYDWSVDLDSGLLSFGDRYTWPVQLLGTESRQSHTWLWSWANESVSNEAVTVAAAQLRDYGEQHQVPELVEPQLELEERVNGHTLGLVASSLCGADAYYLGHYEGGAALMLIQAPELRQAGEDPLRLIQVFTQFISAFPCHHRTAFLGYLQAKGYTFTETADAVQAVSPRGEGMQATFDAAGRLTHLGGPVRSQDPPP